MEDTDEAAPVPSRGSEGVVGAGTGSAPAPGGALGTDDARCVTSPDPARRAAGASRWRRGAALPRVAGLTPYDVAAPQGSRTRGRAVRRRPACGAAPPLRGRGCCTILRFGDVNYQYSVTLILWLLLVRSRTRTGLRGARGIQRAGGLALLAPAGVREYAEGGAASINCLMGSTSAPAVMPIDRRVCWAGQHRCDESIGKLEGPKPSKTTIFVLKTPMKNAVRDFPYKNFKPRTYGQ
jgi:hypothetical protein